MKKTKTFLLFLIFVFLFGCSNQKKEQTEQSKQKLDTSGLVGYWNFDAGSGNTVQDLSGNNWTGTFNSSPSWAAGKINGGISLNGSDFIDFGNISAINGVSQASLVAWIKKTSASSRVLVGKQVCCYNDFIIEAWDDGNIYFQSSRSGEGFGYTSLSDTQWHHVALVFNGTLSGNSNRLKGYIDGAQVSLSFVGSIANTTTTNTTPFRIGRAMSDYSNGSVDEVYLFSRALSGSEVQELYQDTGTPQDTTPPSAPSNLNYSSTEQTVSLTWTASTDDTAVSGYNVYRNSVKITSTTSLNFNDSGLVPGQNYTYAVSAFDAAGNESSLTTVFASTQQDTVFPVVSITSPASSAIVSGQVQLSASVSDNIGVSSVEFFIDNNSVGVDNSSPYSLIWNSSLVGNGQHELRVDASDSSGNLTTELLQFGVDNATADTQAPSIPQNLSASLDSQNNVSLSWQASTDNVGVVEYRTYKDNSFYSSTSNLSMLDTNTTELSTYSYTVSAIDAAGNESGLSQSVSITIPGPISSVLLKPSANGRYFTDQLNVPVFLNGEAAWSAIVGLSSTDARNYLDNCVQNGFNLVLVNLLEHEFTNNPPRNTSGDLPFQGAAFQSNENEAYFDFALWFVREAAARGIYVLLNPAYIGYPGTEQGWDTELVNASSAQVSDYGNYVGSKFGQEDNILWALFGDATASGTLRTRVNSLQAGIASADSKHVFYTHHYLTDTDAHDVPESWLTFDFIYTYLGYTHVNILEGYNKQNIMPVIMGEGLYENENGASTLTERRQIWGAVMSGAAGHIFGNRDIWGFGYGLNQGGSWQSALNNTGRVQMSYVNAFLQGRSWWLLVPDQNNAFVVSGKGSFNSSGYVTAAVASDDSWAAVYSPSGSGSITINGAELSGQFLGKAFNTRTGAYTDLGTYQNSGTHQIAKPDSNDWVFVFESFSGGNGGCGCN